MKDFWAEKHKENNKDYLTGSDLYGINNYMELPMFPNMVVLNIGVGLGTCTKQLKELTDEVYVLDICKEAIEKVNDVIVRGYTNPESLPRYKFDLIISHLVTQHINQEEIIRHIKYGIQALSLQGEFVMQIAVPIDRDNVEYTEDWAKVGSIKYTLDFIINAINDLGGRVSQLTFYQRFPQYNMDWYIVHIKRINQIQISEPEE